MNKRKRRSFCNHYRAMSNHTTCEAGVEYESFKGIPFEKRPCFCVNGIPNGDGCDSAEYPTKEELAACEEAWLKDRSAKIGKARTAIVAACGGPWKKGHPSTGGKINCPCCDGGTLAYSRAGYNGHVHAKCSTEGCVEWME